jgi:hypothetical protein
MISQSYIDGLTRQVFYKNYIFNGMFPCTSDIVQSIRTKKVEWTFNDRFEYRVLLATSNTGGFVNTQVFNENVSLRRPNKSTFGIFKATYGAVMDGFHVDMTINLETDSQLGSFINQYSIDVHSMRVNVAALAKNAFIQGQFVPVHRLMAVNAAEVAALPGGTPELGTPFTITTPMNVFASGYKNGRHLIKTSGNTTGREGWRPYGDANVAELYMILDNQPYRLTLVPVGTIVTPWQEFQYLEVFGNRGFAGSELNHWGAAPSSWEVFNLPNLSQAQMGVNIMQWNGTGMYSAGQDAATGAFEGLSDLFPWHLNPNDNSRMGLELEYRNQPNRLFYTAEQAGNFYLRRPNESIIDAILAGVNLSAATAMYQNVGVWMNPDTMVAMSIQETADIRVIRDVQMAKALTFQRGITAHDYQIGSKLVPATLKDYNLPTDVVIVGPRDEIYYNCWSQDMWEMDKYIQETFTSSEPPKPSEVAIPNELATALDIRNRIIYGRPSMGDQVRTTEFMGGNKIHPRNVLPIAFQEMGTLFTENPHAFTVVHLRRPIVWPSDVNQWAD